MDKATIADVLEKIATLLELRTRTRSRFAPTRTRPVRSRPGAGTSPTSATKKFSKRFRELGRRLPRRSRIGRDRGVEVLRRTARGIPGGHSRTVLAAGIGREKDKGAPRATAGQLDRAIAGSVRRGAGGGTAGIRQNHAGKTLPGHRRTAEIRRLVSAWEDRGGGGTIAGRPARPSRSAPCLHCRQLSPPEGDRARSRFHRGHIRAGGDLRDVRSASARRIGHRPGTDEIERALAFGDSMRSAGRDGGGIPVRAELFYRQQGAQHRSPEPGAAARLDVERIPARRSGHE